MNPDPLDELLSAYSKEPTPLPPAGSAEIWREIARRRRRPFWSGLLPTLDWSELFREPRLAIPALTVALAAGMLPAVLAYPETRTERIRASLHFEMFSVQATGFNVPRLTAPTHPSGQP